MKGKVGWGIVYVNRVQLLLEYLDSGETQNLLIRRAVPDTKIGQAG
jgi:hypothetical protein